MIDFARPGLTDGRPVGQITAVPLLHRHRLAQEEQSPDYYSITSINRPDQPRRSCCPPYGRRHHANLPAVLANLVRVWNGSIEVNGTESSLIHGP